MIKKKISLLIAGAMAISLIATPINQTKTVFAAEKTNSQSIQKTNVNSEGLKDILKVEEYDNFLRKYTFEENIKKNEKIILRRALVKRVGYDNLQALYKKSDANKEAIDWLLSDSNALELYITGGQVEGTYTQSIQALSNVYAEHKEDLKDEENGDLYKKMMISLAISHSRSIGLWTGSGPKSYAPKRYEIYKKLYLEDKLANKDMFKRLPVELMRWVMDSNIDDEEISWLNQHARKHTTKTQNYDLNPYRYISYDYSFKYNYNEAQYYSEANKAKWDKEYDLSKNGVSYGNKGHHKLWMVFEEGSVCGGLSKTGTNLNQVFGIPGAVIGQPAHAAYLSYSENAEGKGLWSLGNDISGWTQSEKGERLPLGWGSTKWDSYYNVSYILLSQGALNDYENYVKALKLNLLAESYSDNSKKETIYKEALKIQKFNLDSMVGLINTYKAQPKKTSADYLELSKMIVDAYTYYPVPLVDVLNLIDEKITDKAHLAVFELLKTNALNKASVATAKESLQHNNCRNLAKSLLGKNTVKLASFSLSGENANKIIINSKYKDANLKVRYSLDGGESWTVKNEHSITLTDEEVSKINEKNDIRVGLEGTDEFCTIDIKKAAKPENKILFKNELENRVVGKTDHLEYSVDGKIWTDHTPESKFEGDIKIMFRYKPNGVFLQSDIAEYQFKEDTYTDTNKYITVDKLKFVKASSQQSNSSEHKATNMLDANYNTGWHTRYSGDNEKYYIVEFDDVKYLSSVDYVPFGLNGRLKNGVIYTSLDGKDWKEAVQIKNLANDVYTKNIKLQKPTEAKFVKIVATSTYGHYTQENKFFSGKVFNFYEDITIKNKENVVAENKTAEQNKNNTAENENTASKNAESKENKAAANQNAENAQNKVEANENAEKKEYEEPVITYSTTEMTDKDVKATIKVAEGYKVIGESTHTFTRNGVHKFKYKDSKGIEREATAEVNNISKDVP